MGRPALGPREQSSAQQGHPDAGTHLRDEATARHRVEAKLGHILGLGTLSPPACQQKELLFFSSRPERSRAPGQAWAALLGRGWSEGVLHIMPRVSTGIGRTLLPQAHWPAGLGLNGVVSQSYPPVGATRLLT